MYFCVFALLLIFFFCLAKFATQSFNFHRVSRFVCAFAFAFAFHVFFVIALRSLYFLCVLPLRLSSCPAITTPLERQAG